MAREITARCFISVDGAPEVLWDSLSEQQKAELGIRLRDRMKAGIEEYYSRHPEEWIALTGS